MPALLEVCGIRHESFVRPADGTSEVTFAKKYFHRVDVPRDVKSWDSKLIQVGESCRLSGCADKASAFNRTLA